MHQLGLLRPETSNEAPTLDHVTGWASSQILQFFLALPWRSPSDRCARRPALAPTFQGPVPNSVLTPAAPPGRASLPSRDPKTLTSAPWISRRPGKAGSSLQTPGEALTAGQPPGPTYASPLRPPNVLSAPGPQGRTSQPAGPAPSQAAPVQDTQPSATHPFLPLRAVLGGRRSWVLKGMGILKSGHSAAQQETS